MRSVNYATAPFRYFPAKHTDEIAVQLNRIDHVKRQKQQTNAGEIKDNLVDRERQIAPRRRRWLRKQVQNREDENGIQSKENPDSDKPRPKFVPAKISMPRLFSGKARTSCRPLSSANVRSRCQDRATEMASTVTE